MRDRVLVTGGAGYGGARVCSRLLANGTPVRVLDSLLHGQNHVAESLERAGAELFRYVAQVDDPRDYRVSFEKIGLQLGSSPANTVDDGVREVIAALEAGAFGDPYDPKLRNTP